MIAFFRLGSLWFLFLALCSEKALAQDLSILKGVNAKSVAFSKDGRWVAAGGTVAPISQAPEDLAHEVLKGTDGLIKVWDARSGQEVFNVSDSSRQVNCLAFSPTGPILAVGFQQKGVSANRKPQPLILWDVSKKHKPVVLPEASSYDCLAFSPDGKLLASGSSMGKIAVLTIWDSSSGEQKQRWEFKHDPRKFVDAVAFSPDGNLLAFAEHFPKFTAEGAYKGDDETRVQILSMDTGKVVATFLSPHASKVVSMAFSFNGKFLASGSRDRTVKIFEPGREKIAATIDAHNIGVWGVAFHPASPILFTAGRDRNDGLGPDGTWKAWDIPSGRLVHTAIAQTSCLAISPDGQRMVTGDRGATVKIWSMPKRLRPDE
jgi:WD40 repeat protein